MRLLALLGAISLAALVNGAIIPQLDKVRYDDYAVYKIHYTSKQQLNSLLQLAKPEAEFDVWIESKDMLEILVSPKALREFHEKIRQADVSAELLIPNVQELIDYFHLA